MPHAQITSPLAGQLTPNAVRRLATLADNRKYDAEAAIALAPFSFRIQLYAPTALIANVPTAVDAAAVAPTRIELTAAGKDAISECADWVRRSTDSRDADG